MTLRVPVTALSGQITLAPGINFKVDKYDLTEDIRNDDGEGLEDGGFAMPVTTGKKLMGTASGSLIPNMAGIGAPTGSFQGVTFTATLTTGVTLTGLCTVSKFRVVVTVGKKTTYECDFESFGPYNAPAWPSS